MNSFAINCYLFVQKHDIELDNLSISLFKKHLLKEIFMKITSTNFGCGQTKNIEFDNIMLVFFQRKNNYSYEEEQTIVYQVSIHDHPLKISKFFKDVSNFMKSKVARASCHREKEYYQFVLSSKEHDFFPVKWFTLWLNNGDTIKHDIAFSVTLIKKNNENLHFGRFNFSDWEKHPKYRELNIKRNAFKYISNQIAKTYKSK